MAEDKWYTQEELRLMIEQMQHASDEFYSRAQKIGNHPFIEFTGFMNEYIKMCKEAAASGFEFPRANTHTEMAIPMQHYHADYIGEKFDCIFGPSFRKNPRLKAAFDRRLQGQEA
jgi:hypothetical protein